MSSTQSNKLWKEILFVLSTFEQYLNNQLIKNPEVDWRNYVSSVHNGYEQTIKDAKDASIQNVYSTTGNIAGLSRYRYEFYWTPDVDEVVSKHLTELAHLRVELLNSYGL